MRRTIQFRVPVAWLAVLWTAGITTAVLSEEPTPGAASVTVPTSQPPGEAEILKLTAAKVGDETIIAFIKNSGRVHPLSANDILQLRAQGVSDAVLTAMLNQRTQATPSQQLQSTQPAEPIPSTTTTTAVVVQPSTVYVSRPSYVYSYWDPWPGYVGYWGYPGISIGFRFGGGHFGGYHGWGGYRGGGAHAPGGRSGGHR